jgi:hypothetical protein
MVQENFENFWRPLQADFLHDAAKFPEYLCGSSRIGLHFRVNRKDPEVHRQRD